MGKKKKHQENRQEQVKRDHSQTGQQNLQTAAPEFLPGQSSGKLPDHPSTRSIRQRNLENLQHVAGNRETLFYLKQGADNRAIQRVPVQVSQPGFSETLYNEEHAQGQFTSNTYSGWSTGPNFEDVPVGYEMTRTSSGVTVNVRIRFVAEFGTGGTGGRAAQPLPEGTARESASNICSQLVTLWNNKFELVGRLNPTEEEESAPPPDGGVGPAANEEIQLPLSFQATPVFDLGAQAHSTVRFDASSIADAENGRVIDAANWYANMDPNVYGGTVADTYAHEYGHLLGIPDEYSLSNPAAHALMHQLSPSEAVQANDRLDDAATNQMILAALRPQLAGHLRRAGRQISNSLSGQRHGMIRQLAEGLRNAWSTGDLTSGIESSVAEQLTSAGQERPAGRVGQVVNFETRRNLNERGVSMRVINSELNAGNLQSMILNSLQAALAPFDQSTVSLPGAETGGGTPTMSLEVAPAISAEGSPLAASASSLASQVVGTPQPGSARGRRVPVYPSGTLLNELTNLPDQWTDLESAMEPVLQYLPDDIQMNVEAALAQNDMAGRVNNSVGSLYRVLYQLVNNATVSAAQIAIRSFINRNINVKVEDQVTNLMELIRSEISRHSAATATTGGTSASSGTPPDPALMAAAQQIQSQARNLVNPAAPAAGGNAPQNVRYTMNSLMGDNAAGTGLRTDQMQGIVNGFNNNSPGLRRENEQNFTIRNI